MVCMWPVCCWSCRRPCSERKVSVVCVGLVLCVCRAKAGGESSSSSKKKRAKAAVKDHESSEEDDD